jgi:hypothetical protein
MELVARSEIYVRGVSPSSVLRSRFTVSFHTGLAGFRLVHRRVVFKLPGSSLSASSTLLQSVTNATSSSTAAWSASPELCCPTAHAVCRVRYGWVLPAHRFRLQGLITLLTAFSPANLANHLSGRQRSWAFPFGAFSSHRALRHYCRADPHAVSILRRLPIRRMRAAQNTSASGLCSRCESLVADPNG